MKKVENLGAIYIACEKAAQDARGTNIAIKGVLVILKKGRAHEKKQKEYQAKGTHEPKPSESCRKAAPLPRCRVVARGGYFAWMH